MPEEINKTRSVYEDLRALERRHAEVARMAEAVLAERKEIENQIRVLERTTRERRLLNAAQSIQSAMRTFGHEDFVIEGKVGYKMAKVYAEHLDGNIPAWPHWDDGTAVTVQPPVRIRWADEVHECCRLCYDGGMWFLLDNDGRSWLSKPAGRRFPSRFIADRPESVGYDWDSDSNDWVPSEDVVSENDYPWAD